MILDSGGSVALIILDLSAAFDTVSHNILLDWLCVAGLQGMAADWFSSFLNCRSQAVLLGPYLSSFMVVGCGVSQGSALSLTIFNLYVAGLTELIATFLSDDIFDGLWSVVTESGGVTSSS